MSVSDKLLETLQDAANHALDVSQGDVHAHLVVQPHGVRIDAQIGGWSVSETVEWDRIVADPESLNREIDEIIERRRRGNVS